MARLDNPFLMNLLQSTPEVQAGYMPRDISRLHGLYQPPTGPLYNVNLNPATDLGGDPTKYVDIDQDVINKMEDTYIDTGVEPDMSKIKGSEYRLRPDLIPEMFQMLRPAINTFEREGILANNLGYTMENPLNTEIGLTSPINIAKETTDLVGTNPTSPRNSEMIFRGTGVDALPHLDTGNKKLSDQKMRDLNYEYPENINREALNTLRHEISHNVNELPNYVDSTNFARDINMNELFGIPNAIGSNPLGYYDSDDMSDKDKEELFNRAKDSYYERNLAYYPPSSQPYMSDFFIKNKLQKFNQNKRPWSSSNTYQNYIKPQVKQHFNQMQFDKQQRAANRGEGYYGHKDYKGGFAGNVTQKGPGRSKDDRMADGGLIDLYRYGGFI